MIFAAVFASSFLVSSLENPQKNYPNLWGGSGGVRTFSSETNPETTFGANLLGNFFAKDPFIQGNKGSRNQFHMGGNYTFDLGLPVEAFGGFTFSYADNSTSTSARTMTTFFENFELGARLGHSFTSEWSVGGFGFVQALTGTQSLRNTSGGIGARSGPFASVTLGASTTYSLIKDHPRLPLRSILNVGYRSPNGNSFGGSDVIEFTRFAVDSFKYHALIGSLGAELVYRYFSPFVEYATEYAIATPSSDQVRFADNRQKILLGTRITPIESVGILAGVDVCFGGPRDGSPVGIPKNPPWDIFVGVGFQAWGQKMMNQVGTSRGIVTDAVSGLPLSGVRIHRSGDGASDFVTDSSGYYEFPNLKNGSYSLQAEREGYESATRSFDIRNGADSIVDITMGLSGPKKGGLALSILDQSTQSPLRGASVSVSGDSQTYASNDAGQISLKDVVEGPHDVKVEAQGYVPQSLPLTITRDQVLSQTIALEKAIPPTGTCRGVVKNPDGTPLTAVVTATDGSVQPFGTDPLTGAFQATLPAGSHELKVQAENYLPQTVICAVNTGEAVDLTVQLEKPKEAVVIDNKIVLPDAIYFAFNKATIKQESLAILDQVAGLLLDKENYKILHIEGHTDDIGGDGYNQKLSEKRAKAVRQYLIKKGVGAAKIDATGFGESRPVSTNTTEEGRAENRRVEFNLERE